MTSAVVGGSIMTMHSTRHAFRDTFASRLVQRGMSLFKTQKLLGHSRSTMTQKYAKLAPGARSPTKSLPCWTHSKPSGLHDAP